MPDFTSSLYLGLRHPSTSLSPWDAFSLGGPAALQEPPGATVVAKALAELQSCEAATLLPSTLHLFWDLFGVLSKERIAILMDSAAYPVAGWGVERAAGLGVPMLKFPHHNPIALEVLIRRRVGRATRPVIVADGYCPSCSQAAPVQAYSALAQTYGGYLVLDDTQALGILGDAPSGYLPYGIGGGGSLRRYRVGGPHIVVGASLAKGFGVPVAVLAGAAALIGRFKAESETRVHCSPPSIAAVHAVAHALRINREHGEALRLRLSHSVARFRQRLAQAGLTATGGLFPVQTLSVLKDLKAVRVYQQLLRQGVQAVLRRACEGLGARLAFLITAMHRLQDIDLAVAAVARAAKYTRADM